MRILISGILKVSKCYVCDKLICELLIMVAMIFTIFDCNQHLSMYSDFELLFEI